VNCVGSNRAEARCIPVGMLIVIGASAAIPSRLAGGKDQTRSVRFIQPQVPTPFGVRGSKWRSNWIAPCTFGRKTRMDAYGRGAGS